MGRHSPKRKAQFMANLQKIQKRERAQNKENNPPPTVRLGSPEAPHPTHSSSPSKLHRNTLRARAETEHKLQGENERYEAAKRDLRNTRRREHRLRQKNAELQEEHSILVDELEEMATMQAKLDIAQNRRLEADQRAGAARAHARVVQQQADERVQNVHLHSEQRIQEERQMFVEELRRVREEAGAIALQHVRAVNDRAVHAITLARQQAEADVRAAQEQTWAYAGAEVQQAEAYYRTVMDAVHADTQRQLREAVVRGERDTARCVREARAQATVILLAAEEQATVQLRLAEEHASSSMLAATERAAETVHLAREHGYSMVLEAQRTAEERRQQDHADAEASHAKHIHEVEAHAIGLLEAARCEADMRAHHMHVHAERRAAERIKAAEECAGILVQAAYKEAAIQVQDAESRAVAAEEHAEEVEEDAAAQVTGLRTISMALEERLLSVLEQVQSDLAHTGDLIASHRNVEGKMREEFQARLDDATDYSETLQKRTDVLRRKNDSLRKKVERFPERETRAVNRAREAAEIAAVGSRTLNLKEKGIIPDSTRALIRDLIALGLKVGQVRGAITTIAQATGLAVEGDISDRSVSRIIGEGYLAAMMQIVEEVERADATTLSSDGTGIKNIQHDAHHIEVIEGSEHRRFTLGVTTAANHTSETQRDGWISLTATMYDIYNASPRGQVEPADHRTFATKIVGMLTDHAEDQKKLVRLIQEWKRGCDRELRGERERATMAIPELLLIIAEETTASMGQVDVTTWTSTDFATRNEEIARAVILRIGENAYSELSEEDRGLADLFVHAGCCMHKELNAVKGGYAYLEQFWEDSGLDGPVLLLNRDNEDAVRAGGPAAQKATEKSHGGAIKLTDLAGALFRHKDDKKGQQNAFRYHFEDAVGELFTFPDTSNTRFGSNGDAASVLITYLPLMSDFLEQIRDRKISGKWNHLEQNVYKGLQDKYTLTELCILSLYSQAVGHPYMREVRRPDHPNHLTLGPFHEQVREHIKRIIADPDILLGSEATHVNGALDGAEWDRPDAFVAVQRLIPILPHVRDALVAFFKGALATWERFSVEFAPGGVIDQLTEVQRGRVYMAATNDANEGLLGACRVDTRHDPNISMTQWNARKMYKMNGTQTYVAGLDVATLKFLRAKWREYNASGAEKKQRLALAQAAANIAAQRREKKADAEKKKHERQQQLRDMQPMLDLEELTSEQLLLDTIRKQLSWHREWVDTGPRAQKAIPPAGKVTRKDDMLAALRDAVMRYNTTPELQDHVREMLRKFDEVPMVGLGDVAVEWEDEEELEEGD